MTGWVLTVSVGSIPAGRLITMRGAPSPGGGLSSPGYSINISTGRSVVCLASWTFRARAKRGLFMVLFAGGTYYPGSVGRDYKK